MTDRIVRPTFGYGFAALVNPNAIGVGATSNND